MAGSRSDIAVYLPAAGTAFQNRLLILNGNAVTKSVFGHLLLCNGRLFQGAAGKGNTACVQKT